MIKRIIALCTLLAVGLLILPGCGSEQAPPTAVTPAPDSALESVSSKPQLIEFYADW